jgi:predicted DCC family thiol-disulfide oxidoreductase YuxK
VPPSLRERPVLLYDGDCAFCTTCARLLERIGPDAEIVAWQLTDLAELGMTEEQAAGAVQWVQVDGTVRSGHEAIAAVLQTAGGIWRIVGRVVLLPGISWLAARVYRLVADNRQRLPGGTPACAATDGDRRRD